MDGDSLREFFAQRFDSLDREIKEIKFDLREVKAETKKTNGNVTRHEVAIGVMRPRLESLSDEVSEIREARHSPEQFEALVQSAVASVTAAIPDNLKGKVTIEAQSGAESRRITKWDVMIFTAGGAAVFELIKVIEWAIHSLKGTTP